MMKEKLLISACLMGVDCKYSGGNNAIPGEKLSALREKYHIIPVCPEYSGGLPIPRDPSERTGDRVVTVNGRDVTEEYSRGADIAMRLCRRFGCKKALLKEKSPSCGSGIIYDGSFTGELVQGYGVAAELLENYGIALYGESDTDSLL